MPQVDALVRAAMSRWPQVPAAYGWLSLSRRGQWLLHPRGQGWGVPGTEPGEPITNAQITSFIGRNYLADAHGRWFFQNGPQRVFVGLDGAPWVLHTRPGLDGRPQLATHNGLAYASPTHWWISPDGLLYVQSPQGAGLIRDRDLAQVIEHLRLADGQPLADYLDAQPARRSTVTVRFGPDPAVPLAWLDGTTPDRALGFVRHPRPDAPA
ncbi:DUF2946 family protein [Castellaniella hirudinis]|uniref:DUF2946 family protein n=1 Tax=Castellaniella hirudinis TaxID=1144617 RepID=UPI0039C36CDE